jgi:uncharacterized membrane protein
MKDENERTDITAHCSTGLSQSVSVLLAYLFSWVSGLVFLLIEKENGFVRFHAAQSIVLGLVFTGVSAILAILSAIPIIGLVFSLASALVAVGFLVATVVLMIEAYQGTTIRLPVIGKLVQTLVESI